jgi:ATP-dependent RNA helicase DeaD
MNEFKAFGLKDEILKGLEAVYFKEPTPIQKKTIPLALEGKDLIGQAQTGTGKTAAFVLPMLQKINPAKKDIQGLIMTPTRELAIQIHKDIEELSQFLDVKAVCLHGGRNIETQINKLEGDVHIVVGTPGRILDHLSRETLHFGRIELLVLDEADKMLEMGFQEDVETIIAQTGRKKQTLLFSATMPDRVKQLAHRFMYQPPHITVDMKQATTEQIEQIYYVVNQSYKTEALIKILKETTVYLCIIFVNTQKRVEDLTDQLHLNGFDAEALHGGLSQNKREQLMRKFRQAKYQYLVCTDIAARGLDVEGVTHVINYDLPSDTESYIHRVGRTGRANQKGMAISLVSPRQKSIMQRIERGIKAPITEHIYAPNLSLNTVKSTKAGARLRKGQTEEKEGSKHQQEANGDAKRFRKKRDQKKEQVKPGYKKKQALQKQKEEQQEKRNRIQQSINQRLQRERRKGNKA